jgi:hypothetical protein
VAAAVVEAMVTGAFTAWVVAEALIIWAQRPPVVFDSWTHRWRAQRAMQKQPTYHTTYPPLFPPAPEVTEVPRLRVVDDLAS